MTNINIRDRICGDTALKCAIKEENEYLAIELLTLEGIIFDDTVDSDRKTCLMLASEYGLDQVVGKILPKLTLTSINKKDKDGTTALMYAKNDFIADQLLDVEGIEDDNVDDNGMTCLMWASRNGLERRVKRLLAKLSIDDINKKDQQGRTALMWAKNDSVADQLQDIKGIEDFNVDHDGKTCLIWAVQSGLEQRVKRLLTKMSITDINKRDRYGYTALKCAIRGENKSIAGQLLKLEGIEVEPEDDNSDEDDIY